LVKQGPLERTIRIRTNIAIVDVRLPVGSGSSRAATQVRAIDRAATYLIDSRRRPDEARGRSGPVDPREFVTSSFDVQTLLTMAASRA